MGGTTAMQTQAPETAVGVIVVVAAAALLSLPVATPFLVIVTAFFLLFVQALSFGHFLTFRLTRTLL
jgi:hypothetical protein